MYQFVIRLASQGDGLVKDEGNPMHVGGIGLIVDAV